jgi:hypothetical protein
MANFGTDDVLSDIPSCNDLTLILLTWRKWWAPNNASKQQMGFNSAFKGLIPVWNNCFPLTASSLRWI